MDGLGEAASFAEYYEAACNNSKPARSHKSTLKALMAMKEWKDSPLELREAVMGVLKATERAATTQIDVETAKEAKRPATDKAICDSPPRKRVKAIKRGEDACKDWKKKSEGLKTTADEYAFCLKIEAAMTGDNPERPQSSMTDSARKWARNRRDAAAKMRVCVEKCWNGDKKGFLESKTKLNVTKYKCTCKK